LYACRKIQMKLSPNDGRRVGRVYKHISKAIMNCSFWHSSADWQEIILCYRP